MDPLGDLCLAAAEDAEQENRQVNDHHVALYKPIDTVTPGDAQGSSSTEKLIDLYRDQCNSEGVDPHEDHINILRGIPRELVLHTRECHVSKRVTGGALVRVSGGCPLQVGALLTTLAPPKDATILPVVDTLDLSSVKISVESLAKMVGNSLLWGPWWRLRCLILKDSGLGLHHLQALASADAVPSFWNLEYLDISHNSSIGLTEAGVTRGPEEFAGVDVAFLIHFWKQTKLRYLNVEHCHLGARALKCILTILRKYEIPSSTLECGFAMHSGARPALESLVLGNVIEAQLPTDNKAEMEVLISAELACLVSELPKISFLKFEGISEGHVSEIARSWESKVPNRQKKVSIEDSGLRLATCDGPVSCLPFEHVLPDSSFDIFVDDLEEKASPQLPEQILDDFGLNKAIQKPAAANDAETQTLVATNQLDKYSLNIISPGKISKRNHRQNVGSISKRSVQKPRAGNKSQKLYRGGDRNDALPCDEIVIRSDDSEEDSRPQSSDTSGDGSSASGSSQSHDSGEGPTTQDQAQALQKTQEKFRLRDGMLDEDSRLGRLYRSDARKNILRIPNGAHQKAARRAFKLWDQCTENSWDRRRWDNPSKTQNDEPHILGQLNLLFDILDRYKLGIGFPFPLWKKGQGEHAFDVQENPSQEIRQRESPVLARPHAIVETEPQEDVANAGRPGKNRAFVLSSDEDEENVTSQKGTSSPNNSSSHDNSEEVKGLASHDRKAKLRELNRLSAWAWDSRVEDHPPNEEVYGPARGKRQRKQLHGDMASLFESHEEDTLIDERAKVAASMEWQSDDDLPLFPAKHTDLTTLGDIIPDSQDSDEE